MTDKLFDVVVIGAGIAGASIAAELARTHHVAVLERESVPGYHSTGRSAALFSEIYGNSVVRALSRASRAFFYSPPHGFSETALVKPRAALHIAPPGQVAKLEQFAANRDVSAAIRRLTPEEALRACPILRPEYTHAAVLEPDAADVDVDALHQGYLRAFRAAGGTLITDSEVERLTHSEGAWRIQARETAYRTPILVNAAGAWVDTIATMAGGSPLGIQPCRRTAVLVEPPAAFSPETWPMVIDADETFYIKPDAGLLLISPADETPLAACDVQPEELDIAIAIDRVEQATTLKVSRIRKRWAGLRSFAPDRSPVIGLDPVLPNFFWLAGQGGYGIQTAPAAAKIAAALLRGDSVFDASPDIDLTALSPRRFRRVRSHA
jgi:D-arginine dehydrogenase